MIEKKQKVPNLFNFRKAVMLFSLSSLFLISVTPHNLDWMYTDKHKAFWSFSACLCYYETALFWESHFKAKLCIVLFFFFERERTY